MRALFIGEAPSRSTSRSGAALVGETGRRLASWAGVSASEFHKRVACRNLFDHLPSKWDREEAMMRAALLLVREHGGHAPSLPVVLLGEKVADAFGVKDDQRHTPYRWYPYPTAARRFAVMPHPSGLNHHWNDEANVRRAERFLRRLLGVTTRRPRQARLPIRGEMRT